MFISKESYGNGVILGSVQKPTSHYGPANNSVSCSDNLSAVDSKLPVDEVCRQFRSFTRLKCEKIEVDSLSTSSDDDPVQPNAFHVLLMNQRFLSSKSTLPARLEPRNNKDKLFNDLVLLFEKTGSGVMVVTHMERSSYPICVMSCGILMGTMKPLKPGHVPSLHHSTHTLCTTLQRKVNTGSDKQEI